MKKHNFAFTDIETTGLDYKVHEIIEIGCIVARQFVSPSGEPDLEVLDEFVLKIKPEHLETADPKALKVNGYNEDDWRDAISLTEALEIYAKRTQSCSFIAQNVTFDWMFLSDAFHKTGVKPLLHYLRIDLMSMVFAKLYKSDLEKFSLREMCKYFGVNNEKEHTAMADTRAMFEIYKKMMAF